MDAYEKMGNASKLMKEAFDDLQEMMEELEEQIEMKSKALDAAMKKLLAQERRDYDRMLAPPGNEDIAAEDFLDRKHFKKSIINADDERFYTGVEMQIRMPRMVQTQREDMFVPMDTSLIRGEDE